MEVDAVAVTVPRQEGVRVQVESDGTCTVLGVGQASMGSPRPLDEDEIEAIAGGGNNLTIQFTDGCQVTLQDFSGSWNEAWEQAQITHDLTCSRA